MKKRNIELTNEEKAYIAGFLDGDGCILSQIVKGSYRYNYTIRVSIIFYQKSSRYWFLLYLKRKLTIGNIRYRPDGMCEYNIVGLKNVKLLLLMLQKYLVVKKELCQLVLKIIEDVCLVESFEDFLKVCILVDKSSKFRDSKKRKITSEVVKSAYKSL